MLMREVTVTRKDVGSHELQLLVQRANRFEAEIFLERQNKRINAKSIMGVLSLGLKADVKVVVICKGADEAEALADLTELIARDFTL